MEMRQLLLSCCGAFFIGMLTGIAVVLWMKLKNLSLKRKHEFREPASLKREAIPLSEEAMAVPVQDTADGHTALQEFKQHS